MKTTPNRIEARKSLSLQARVCERAEKEISGWNQEPTFAFPSKPMDRNETIAAIKSALQKRSGKSWSVTGGRGTAWGWIKIDAPPSRCTWSHRLKAGATTDRPEDYEEYNAGCPGGSMSPDERRELGQLLGLDGPAHIQGVSIAASSDYYNEYIARARGAVPSKVAQPYWD